MTVRLYKSYLAVDIKFIAFIIWWFDISMYSGNEARDRIIAYMIANVFCLRSIGVKYHPIKPVSLQFCSYFDHHCPH